VTETPVYWVSWNFHHRRFTGVEFAVSHSEPPTFFIIQKRERLSPDEGQSWDLPSSLETTFERTNLQFAPWPHISS